MAATRVRSLSTLVTRSSGRGSHLGTKVVYGHDGEVEWVDIESGEVTETGQRNEEPAWFGNDKLIV